MKVDVEHSASGVLLIPYNRGNSAIKVESDWFESEYWHSQGRVAGSSQGRTRTWFIKPPSELQVEPQHNPDWVLRHYYRGGMVAKLSKDKFVYFGLTRSRPYREISLLLQMQNKNLPVPICVGARIVRHGLNYSADLLMEKIVADDLVKVMNKGALSQSLWNAIGKTIAQFHRQGVHHADLNAHNIMVDQQKKVWVIDFDRCKLIKPNSRWQQKNLDRLRRSFEKEKHLNSKIAFEKIHWTWLSDGYKQVINT